MVEARQETGVSALATKFQQFETQQVRILTKLDEHRTNTDWQRSERFRRHVLQKALTPKDGEALIGSSVFSQYKQRMFLLF